MSSRLADLHSASEEFVVTKEHRRFVEFCDACLHYRYIGVCYGPPGVGKTLSARRYARWDLLDSILPGYTGPETSLPARISACRTVLYTPTIDVRPGRIVMEVESLRRSLSYAADDAGRARRGREPRTSPPDRTEMIIVDEVDRLSMTGLEQLRDIYDRDQLGLILIGMPGIEKRLGRYPQLYSRVGFVHQFRPLSAEEILPILEKRWRQLEPEMKEGRFADAEATAAIIRTTGGNFRLIQRLLAQIERILKINDLHTVTKEVVETARESLVIGTVYV
jgi:DNA transposition AAA+ family ATPase